MGFSTGICLPFIRLDQSGPGEGESLPGSGAHAHSSILASASVVSGAADSASSSISVGSSASATRQKIPPKPVHASSSCVETQEIRESLRLLSLLDDLGKRGGSLQ